MKIRNIRAQKVTKTVARLCQEANYFLPNDVHRALKQAHKTEESPLGRQTLDQILANAQLATETKMAMCQDCGIAVVYLEIGQDTHITGGNLYEAINEGVRQGYEQGYLRKSMVRRPYSARVNTQDNTPAVIHTDIIPGDKLKITVMPKGGGSENMSRLFMLTPEQGRSGIIEVVLRAVNEAGSNPCPPVIVGVGIGGTAEIAMALAKKATLRPLGSTNSDPENVRLEKELTKRVNALGIGPEGLGGQTTALAVHIELFPSHIASLPIAVSLQCHAARQKEAIL
ncbi:MAG: fumarate hydratase [Dehalococcoidales bacterium]|nr:fumarate hydratase [Dehalococcoidales bacterium]MDP7110196.1 fumarate hydratase [Dehalococcoidales bacterium]MDP7310230.1 fumarate hydratase [Dehalococcoidales bacterium]MDP7409222.1 fumarate hydratase [Dehalococcoidales bacterium]MDP7675556.1 fumarate hydratase [Dehalococcoidales bacterium]